MTATVIGCVYGAPPRVVDLYGGPGGWSEGLRPLGLTDVGVELDAAACATRRAAGHRTIRADVTRMPVAHLAGRVDGLIASPPCQAFSLAGAGEGRLLIHNLRTDIAAGNWAAPYPEPVRHVLEVGRWVEAVQPTWVVCEQVPTVLPLWQMYAHRFRGAGYYAWAGNLQAADYGVPQTRLRAVLIASLAHPVAPPIPTHTEGGGETLFGRLAPWVSMADALGWDGEDASARTLCGARSPRWMYPDPDGTHGRTVGFPRRDDRGDSPDGYRARDWFPENGPAPAITGKARSMVVRTGANSMVTGRTTDDIQRYERPVTEPAPTVDTKAGSAWTFGRPATTVAGDPRLSGPGRNDPAVPGSQYGENSVKLTIEEALILQGFPAGYPLQGTKTARFRQNGNAVPPPLATAVVASALGLDWRELRGAA